MQQEVETVIREWETGMETVTVQTSGSTGPPKQIVLKRAQLIASARRTLDAFGLASGDSALLGISPKTIGGKMMIVRALLGNLRLIVCSPSANPLGALQPGETLDFCPLVPMQAKHILEHTPEKLGQVSTFLFGGAPLPATLEQELAALHPSCYIGFGMTETVSHIALRKLGNPLYGALPGVTFSAEDDQLIITDKRLGIERLITNDSVELIDAAHFRWLGRTDFVINSGGIKIHPEQVEQALADLIGVPFFVSSEPDDTFGQKCILIMDETNDLPDLAQLQEHCRKTTGPYSAPKKLYSTRIVYTAGSKIDRRATLQQLGIVS